MRRASTGMSIMLPDAPSQEDTHFSRRTFYHEGKKNSTEPSET